MTPYLEIRSKIVNDLLDKFPDAPSLTLARMLYKDYPRLFTVDIARSMIRRRRGAQGLKEFYKLKDKKYAKYRV